MLIFHSLAALTDAIGRGQVRAGDFVILPEALTAHVPEQGRADLGARLRRLGAEVSVSLIGTVILVVRDEEYARALYEEGHARAL